MSQESRNQEIAKGIIQECKILLSKIRYLEKASDSERPSFSSAPTTLAAEEKQKAELTNFVNRTRRRKLKVKAYFTLLIFDLIHVFNLDENLAAVAEAEEIDEIKRYRYGKVVIVHNFKELIIFFRDAISHPEENNGLPSPRRSVKYNYDISDTFMRGSYDKVVRDVIYQIGDCRISLRQITTLLQRMLNLIN